MASQTILKAKGLATQPNELNVEEGSLLQASNVIIKNDNTIESRRGFRLYGETFGTTSDVAKQLMEYKSRILRHYESTLQYDTLVEDENGNSVFNSFSGSYSEVQPGLRIKSIESNGNLYFTTNDGIKRISATSANDFNTAPGLIQDSGGPKALNINTSLNITEGSSTGFLPQDSTVAYRVAWGYTDANSDEILGSPSQRSVIYFALQTQLIRDFNQLLYALDNLRLSGDSYITSGTYVNTYKLPISASANDIYNNLISLATVLDQAPGNTFSSADISTVSITGAICTVTIGASVTTKLTTIINPGDSVYLDGFTLSVPTSTPLQGVYTVLNVDNAGKTFTFNTTSTGTVTFGSATVQRGKFRSIAAPHAPTSPVTDAMLVSLQTCLSAIIDHLQLPDNMVHLANATGASVPFTISTAGIASGHATFFLTPDPTTRFKVGDYIYLSGFVPAGGGSLDGHFTLTAVSSSQIEFTCSAGTGGVNLTNGTLSKIVWFGDDLQSQYIFPLNVTSTANVDVQIVIPPDVTTSDFYQVYRSSITSATGTDILNELTPDDEMRLVFESFPTQAQIDAGTFTITDITPDSFVQGSTYLYTNEISGDGILQANDVPPLATDLNKFKNVIFYSNTKTKQKLNLSLLGLTKIFQDSGNGLVPTLSIASSTSYNEYRFVPGVQQVVNITCNNTFANTGPSTYFLINNANDKKTYYVWYQWSNSVDPQIAGATGIRIETSNGYVGSAAQTAQRTGEALGLLVDDFTCSVASNVVTVTYVNEGIAAAPLAGTSSFTFNVATTGRGEKIKQNVTRITCVAGSTLTNSGSSDYFTLNTPFDRQNYYFWYQVGSSVDPAISGLTGIRINASSGDTSSQIATKTTTAINALSGIYSATANSNIVTATTNNVGYTVPATEHVANAGFLISTTQAGATDVLLSSLASPSLAVEQTALSLINVINLNKTEILSGFYLSGPTDVPGLFLLEAQKLSTNTFYIQTNASGTGASFQPNISPSFTSLSVSNSNPAVVTEPGHGLKNFSQVLLTGTSRFDGSGVFPATNGIYQIGNVTANTFTIPKNVITSGSIGSLSNLASVSVSDNEAKANRIYYSKFLQPDAVPIVNTIDVGATDKAILRIFPLRDSLFVFKEDGLYRLSGENAPFNLALFDSSCVLVAPDSVSVSNNVIYAWTTKGICQITEFGVAPISRAIDVDILPKSTSQYTNFPTATWGIGYESDNSYIVWTVGKIDDVMPTIAYRFSNLTQTWTVFNKTNTCGLHYSVDDKLYLGAGDLNSLEQERKSFDRTDYADREYVANLGVDSYLNNGLTLKLDSVTNVSIGDVIQQNFYITPYIFNGLLQKLDIDPALSPALNITGISWSNGVATVSCSSSIPSYIHVNQYVSISGILPIAYDGVFQVTSISGSSLTFNMRSNPGAYQGGNGKLKFNYLGTFQVVPTMNVRTSLENLCAQLDLDPGITTNTFSQTIAFQLENTVPVSDTNPAVFTFNNHGIQTGRVVNITFSTTTPNINGFYTATKINSNTFSVPVSAQTSGTATYETEIFDFEDIRVCYNLVIGLLNADATTGFKNYKSVTDLTSIECIVTSINKITRDVGVNYALPFVFGPIKIYQSIPTLFEYVPVSAGDSLNMKQFRDSTIIFHDQTFTSATISYSSDLLPQYTAVPITGAGNGLFGLSKFGSGFFGGAGNSAPFRTYVPRNCQRCRFLNIKFEHSTAREKWSILGISVTGRVIQSARAYR